MAAPSWKFNVSTLRAESSSPPESPLQTLLSQKNCSALSCSGVVSSQSDPLDVVLPNHLAWNCPLNAINNPARPSGI